MPPMNSLSDEDRHAYAVIETVLQSQPLAKAPARFAADVLARVKTARRSQALPRPVFRLHWLDVVICGLLSSMVGTMLFIWQIVSSAQMASFRAALRSQSLLFRQQMSFVPQLPFAWLSLALGVLIGLVLLLGVLRAGLLSTK